jgi:hypothetical protein
MKAPHHDDGDWLDQRLDALQPGWRGRLRLAVPDELQSGAVSEIIGTIVEAASIERDPGDDSVTDAFVTLCPNYRGGCFLPTLDEPTITVRASRIAEIQRM